MQIKKQQLELDMEQQTGSKLGSEYVKTVYWHSAYSTLCKVHHAKCQAGRSTSWNQDIPMTLFHQGYSNINKLRYAVDTTLIAESKEELKSLLMKVKKQSE